MDNKILAKECKILMKNNVLIKTKYNLSTLENKMFVYILFKLQKQDNNTMVCEIPIKDIKEYILKADIQKSNLKSTLETLKQILTKLSEEMIEYINKNGEGFSRFIYNFKFINNYKVVRIIADKEVYELFKNYIKDYTPNDLDVFFKFRTSYTQIMYDLVKVWSGTNKEFIYSIENLKKMLNLKEAYSQYGQFKIRVLNPSIKELKEKANININFEEIKTNRKITHIKFIVNDNEQRHYFRDTNKIKNTSFEEYQEQKEK